MGEKVKNISKVFINKQFLLFVFIGGINTLSTAIFSSIYNKVLGGISAFIVGYITGIMISYTLNATFTFHEKMELGKLIKFAISTIPNFVIQLIIVYIGTKLLSIPNMICYGMAAVIGVPVTFLILKIYVFVKRD